MKIFVRSAVFCLILVILAAGSAPLAALQQPGPGKKYVATPFGPIEVDLSDPRPGTAFGPPLPGAAPAPTTPAQPGTPEPTPQAAPDDQVVPIALRFDNQEIYQVIRIIGEVLKINYVIDPAVKGTVNINTAGELRRSDLLPILETILKMNGATMVKVGNVYQIVPASTAIRMPLQIQDTPQVASDDQIVLQVVAMKFVSADEMYRLLTPYLSEGGNIQTQGNVLLVSDRRSNLRKLLEIVDQFDTRAFEGQRVRMLPVKNNAVKDLIEDLKTVFAGYALSEKGSAIRFLPIERLNSILVITPNSSVFPEVEQWLERLDQPLETAGLRTYVYRAKNSKASDIQRVLSELYSDSAPAPHAAAPLSGNATPMSSAEPPAGAPGASSAPGGNLVVESVASSRLTGQLRIIADTINNALVIQATPQDYQSLEKTIEELDVLPRQVLIDAQIYEVVLDHSLSLGISATLQSRGTTPNPQTLGGIGAGSSGAGVLTATTFAFIGRTRELVAFLHAAENRSRVRTLSAPSILVSNNSTARVQIGTEVPVPTSSAASAVQQEGGSLFTQTIAYRDTGVLLNVTPQINAGGNVTLVVAQEISQAGTNTTSAIVAPMIGKSSVSSTIIAHNGETIALTGFIRESQELTRSRVPLLGSIPGLGLLFGNTSHSNNRTELIVLITPHVINTTDETAIATDELKAKLKEVQKLLN